MLQANKGNVLTKFHKKSLDIRNKELNYFLGVFNRLSTVSSILAGFASSAMMMTVPDWQDTLVVSSFLIFTGCAFGTHLLVILITTLCNLWGPGKALCGDDCSHLHEAVDVLEQALAEAMRFFIMGLFCYFISTIMVVWLFFDPIGAVITTVILVFFCFLVVRSTLVLRRNFTPSNKLASGILRGNAVRSDVRNA
eukprot:TRINITY_DN40627_c0_g1_i1.p1 TRINITY_DN40627_c0_g1~~TRINITY_DN40627_c0_g1_i1.p1  ORF type:complete len:195 (+),score=38.92 TRINITY_DN40627_c0_g1_i1:113-697(+)